MSVLVLVLRSVLSFVGAALVLFVMVVVGTVLSGGGDILGSTAGLVALLIGEALIGVVSVAVATRLAPAAPRAHGWIFGGLVLALNLLTVFSPGSVWPLGAGVVLISLVPPQTWVGVRLGTRWRPEPDAPLSRPGSA